MSNIGEQTKFAEILLNKRNELRYTVPQFSDLLGINQHTYRSYERGRTEPPLSVLINMSRLLHCSVDALLGIEEDNQSQSINIVHGNNNSNNNNRQPQLSADCKSCPHIERLTAIIDKLIQQKG